MERIIVGLVLAMLASSALSMPVMGPSYGMVPKYYVPADVQGSPNEVQQQQLMANDPEASLQEIDDTPADVPDFWNEVQPMTNDPEAFMQELDDVAPFCMLLYSLLQFELP